jgi:hypothetical protein
VAYDTVSKYVHLRQELLPAPRSGAWEWGHVAEFSRAISAVLAAGGEAQQPATAEEQQAAQERALWELMAVFSVGVGSANEGVGGPELALWLAGIWRWQRAPDPRRHCPRRCCPNYRRRHCPRRTPSTGLPCSAL